MIVADDEEAVEHAEGDRWHSEEIHGRNRFPMVAKEGHPALGLDRTSRRSLHPTGDGSLGKIKTEHAEFPMDPRCSPGWVLGNHLENHQGGKPDNYESRIALCRDGRTSTVRI
jgi:hypothetical protein